MPKRSSPAVRAAVPALLAAVATALCAPARAAVLPTTVTYERGRADEPLVALTFDGGGDPGDTARILATLADRGVRATFFLTGEYIARFPDLARAIAAAGHEVGNHTWSHPHLTTWATERRQRTLPGVDRDLLRRELAATARAWEDATGLPMAPLWRAPFGEVNATLSAWAADEGWRHVGWTRDDRRRRTLDSLDWVADPTSRLYLGSAAIVARILAFGDPPGDLNGGIVLMHLATRRRDPAASRLAELIDALRSRGYRLVTVHEMLAGEPPDPAPTAGTVALSTPR